MSTYIHALSICTFSISLPLMYPRWSLVADRLEDCSCFCNFIPSKSDLVLCCYCNRAVFAITYISYTNACICIQYSIINSAFILYKSCYMLSSAFYSIVPSIGTFRTVRAYPIANLFYLMELHNRVFTLSAQITSKVTYGYAIVQKSQVSYIWGRFSYFL